MLTAVGVGWAGDDGESAPCADCHEEIAAELSYSAHGLVQRGAPGCTDCHGANLDGENGIATSCYWCHQAQWAGAGAPPDHEREDLGSELKDGRVWHKFGFDDPIANGCTRCHGPNLNDGFALVGSPDMGAFELGSSLPHYGPRTGDVFADGFESGDTTAWTSRMP